VTGTAYYVDGVRVPIGRAKDTGYYAHTRADDLAVRSIRALLERNPSVPPDRIDDVVWAATAQVGDQGLTLGRSLAILAGLGNGVPGYAIDRMCAGALTAIVNAANAIRVGAQDLVLAGGVEHMGHHPMGAEVDPNPRFLSDKLVDPSALVMGNTAENLHDDHPRSPASAATPSRCCPRSAPPKAQADGIFATHVVPMTVRTPEGWRWSTSTSTPVRAPRRSPAELESPFRPGGASPRATPPGSTTAPAGCCWPPRRRSRSTA
jgi:acetyl-CoA acyltransferase